MENNITLEELEDQASDIQIEGLKREAKETADKLKSFGLMAPELCQIAHYILNEYSDKAKNQLKIFGVDLPTLLKKADDLLKLVKESKK